MKIAPLDNFRLDPNDSLHAFCKVCDKKLRFWVNGEKMDCTNLYRHWRTMHPNRTLSDRGPQYPALKSFPCDLNNEGPQAKYHKAFFDQNLKRFEDIGTMRGGGIINEDENNENSDNDNESNDIDENSDNDIRINDDGNDDDDNANDDDDDEDNDNDDDQSIGSDLSEEEEDHELILSKRETYEIEKLRKFLRPIIIWGDKFASIYGRASVFFNNLGYENREDDELSHLGRKIYKSQQKLIDFIENDARKTPLNDALDKIFKLFSSKNFRKYLVMISKDQECQENVEDHWDDFKDFIYSFLDEDNQNKKVQIITDAIKDKVYCHAKLIDDIYKWYSKVGIQFIKRVRKLAD